MILTGAWSVLPPLIAIVLALITKEVYSSLLVGVLSGLVIYNMATGGTILQALIMVPQMMAEQISGNGTMILFLSLLGAVVVVVTMAGGSRAYGNWAREKISSAKGAKMFTALLGMLIFIDDYFNCLTVGTVMRPVTDKFGIAREKLAYFIDATAAPICIIAPVSSWAVAVAGYMGEGAGFEAFIAAIPYNLYALLTLAMVVYLCVTNFDFGPMKKAQEEAKARANGADEIDDADFDGITVSKQGKVYDLLIPIVVLIVFSILGMAYVGGFFDGVDFIMAIGENPTMGLTLGAFVALITAAVLYIPRKLMTFKDFMEGIAQGVKSMVPALLILVLAWSLSSVCRYMIGTGPFVSGLVESSGISLVWLPAFVFVIAAFLSFSMGTAWGTFGILLPIIIEVCSGATGAAFLFPAMGATLAGSVFGDHCSPISDTTILSSAGAKCDHMSHVSTQIPYALFVAVFCFFGYIITGFVGNPWVALVACLVGMVIAFKVMEKKQKSVA
ncbi:MAG: Na+/H+ antiporter NhaC family protein [Lachnospiraceae bacterium]|nr:Na+/H+ antiporter NhaC family protein [Lachnospiraceae bacterium]